MQLILIVLFIFFIYRFSDGETLVLLNDTVRGKHVFVIQTCAAPISDNIVELLQMISAARNSGADRVTAVIPYFGYKFHRYVSCSQRNASSYVVVELFVGGDYHYMPLHRVNSYGQQHLTLLRCFK